MNAIEINEVTKSFRRVSLSRNYRTFKSFFLESLRNKGKTANGANGEKYFKALDNVSLAIPKGGAWGIIGRNGSGKSTLLKLVAGIYRPDSGSIKISGRISALIELGAGFHPEFSGRENVFINASILGMNKKTILEKFDEIVAFAELEDFIDNPVRTYSSGMFMRLGFSVAIHVDPDILLVDEVLAVGDKHFFHKCTDRMENFLKSGKTVLIVSHDLGMVEKWCEGAIFLENGAVKISGKTNMVIDHYLTSVAESENKLHLEREADSDKKDESATNRWGTREVEITSVQILDNKGEERYIFNSGDEVVVAIGYSANTPVNDPVIGVGIYKLDGSHCFGTNTDIDGIAIDNISGDGRAAVSFDSLNLVDGSYTISVAVHAKDGYSYDYHDQSYEFSVRSKIKDVGVFSPAHSWRIDGEVLASEETGS